MPWQWCKIKNNTFTYYKNFTICLFMMFDRTRWTYVDIFFPKKSSFKSIQHLSKNLFFRLYLTGRQITYHKLSSGTWEGLQKSMWTARDTAHHILSAWFDARVYCMWHRSGLNVCQFSCSKPWLFHGCNPWKLRNLTGWSLGANSAQPWRGNITVQAKTTNSLDKFTFQIMVN